MSTMPENAPPGATMTFLTVVSWRNGVAGVASIFARGFQPLSHDPGPAPNRKVARRRSALPSGRCGRRQRPTIAGGAPVGAPGIAIAACARRLCGDRLGRRHARGDAVELRAGSSQDEAEIGSGKALQRKPGKFRLFVARQDFRQRRPERPQRLGKPQRVDELARASGAPMRTTIASPSSKRASKT